MSVGAIVGIANQAVDTFSKAYNDWIATEAHPVANEWVARVQNPFGAQLALIVNAKDAELRAGYATADDVYFAQQSVIKLWDLYQAAATNFANQGAKQSQVIQQSYTTLQPLITRILSDMDTQIAQLGGVSVIAQATGQNVSHYSYLIWFVGLALLVVLVIGLRRH